MHKNVFKSAGTVCAAILTLCAVQPLLAQEINPVDEVSNPDAVDFDRVVMGIDDFRAPFVRDGRLRDARQFVPVTRAMTKDQVLQQIGAPDRQMDNSSDEWVYLIKFELPQSRNFIVCQYNVLFNGDDVVSDAVWRRRQCQNLAQK